MSISQFRLIPSNIQQSKPGNPNGTVSATFVMCGLGITFTPKYTGNLKITAQMSVSNSLANDAIVTQLRFGTGTAPNNGDAVTGTQAGTNGQFIAYANNAFTTITLVAYVPSFTLNIPWWFDISQEIVTGGTGTVTAITYIIEEVQT